MPYLSGSLSFSIYVCECAYIYIDIYIFSSCDFTCIPHANFILVREDKFAPFKARPISYR